MNFPPDPGRRGAPGAPQQADRGAEERAGAGQRGGRLLDGGEGRGHGGRAGAAQGGRGEADTDAAGAAEPGEILAGNLKHGQEVERFCTLPTTPPTYYVQGGPSASVKKYVDINFEVPLVAWVRG